MIQEGPKTDKQKLYDALSGEYDLGTYEEFERNIGDSVKRRKLYDAASADYDLGDYESYSQRIGPTHKESLDAFNAEFGSFMNDFEERDTAETKMSRAGISSGIIVPMEGSITGEERQRYLELHEQEEALKKAWYTSDEYLAQKDAEAFQLAQMRKDIDSGRLAYAQAHPMVEGYNPSATRGAEADKELSMYETASRIMDDTIKLHNAPSRYDGANAWQNVRKFARGAGDTFSDVDFWTMGLTEVADNFGVRDVLATVQDKLGNLNDLSEESIENILTPAEKAVLQAWAINAQEQLNRQGDLSRGYQAGQGAAKSLEFMAEFMLTGGIGKAAAEGVEQMTKWLAKKTLTSKVVGMTDDAAEAALKAVAEKTASSAVRRYGKNLGLSLAEAAGRTGVMPSTFRNISEKATEIRTDEEGNNYLVGMNNAFASGLADSFIETLSEGGRVGALGELFGDVAGKIPFYKRMVDRLSNSKAGELWDMFQSSGVMNTLRAGGWHGIGEEYLEEWYGNALRTLTGVDKEALKEFATWDNQLITVTSFLPLTIFGGTVSTAQVLSAKRGLDKKAAALRSALIDRGYDEAQADNYIDIMKGASPAEISSLLSPIATTVAGRSEMDARALVKPFMDFAMAVRKWQSFDTKYKYQEQEQRDALQQQMEGTLGKFWQEDETGTRRVQRAVNAKGEAVYLLGKQSAADAEAGLPASVPAVTADGRKMFVNPSEYQLEDELDMNTFLGLEIMAEKGNTERARMLADQERSIQQIRQMAAPGTQINLGTAEAPVIATVAQRHPDGVIVTTPDGMARQLTYEELGNYLGINATPLTDAQLDEQEADALLADEAQREGWITLDFGDDQNAAVEIADAEEEIAQSVEAVTELPMDSQGNVDETALWNQDPARWAAWNDEQRQDGGINSIMAVNAAISSLSAQIAEQESTYAAMPVGTERNALEAQINASKDRLGQLRTIAVGYAAQAEAEAQQAAAQEQAALSASQAQMTEQQMDEMDAQYEGIYSQTRSLNERARLLQEYLDKISVGTVPVVVLTKSNYAQAMKQAGCPDYLIRQVGNAFAKNGIIEGFMAAGKAFIVAESIPTIDRGRQKYVHERQHVLVRGTDYVSRILATGVTREQLKEYVRTFSGTRFYDNYGEDVLADELLSFAMELVYTYEDFSVALQKIGVSESLINVIKSIDDEQSRTRNGERLSQARRRRRSNNNDGAASEGGSRQDDRDLGQVSSGLLGQQDDGSLGYSQRGAGDREGGEGAAEPAVEDENNPAFVDATSTDAEGVKFSAKLTDSEIDNLVEAMKANAEVAEDLELTPENWEDQFGTDGMVPTPVGNVKMGENQYLKLLQRKRSQYFGMIRPTLVNPDIVLEELSPSENGERDTVLLFIKTFIKPDGSRYVHFESVTIQKDSMEISISSHEIQEEDLKKKMRNDNVAHLRDSLSASEWRLNGRPSDGSDLVPTPSDNLSDSKDSENLETSSDSARFSVVTPEMDAEYLAAVERGDMETAQRMVLEAAKLAMPNTKVVDENGNPKIVYHGSPNVFYKFGSDSSVKRTHTAEDTHFFVDDMEVAQSYGKELYPVFLNLANPIVKDFEGNSWNQYAEPITPEELKEWEEERKARKERIKDLQEKIEILKTDYEASIDENDIFRIGDSVILQEIHELENELNIATILDKAFSTPPTHTYSTTDKIVAGARNTSDGAIFKNVTDAASPELTHKIVTDYVAYSPSQIKSADPVTYDDNGNVIPLSQRFNPENEDIRFSTVRIDPNANQQAEGNVMFSTRRGSLAGMHNISEEKLRKVIKRGGSANPSTAVIDIERKAFDSYGEISLIMPSSLVDAETGRNAGTFTADAWTPTYPQIEKRFSVDKLQRAYWRDITAIPEEMQHEVRMAFDSWLDNRTASGLAYMFLQERGEAPEMVRVAAKFPQEIKDKMSAILGEGRTGFYELTDEEKQAVLDLYIQENFGGSREDFDSSIAETIQRIEDRLSTGKVPSFVEKRITADLQWMKEHGYNYDNLSDFVRGIVSDIRHAGEVDAAATTNRALDYIKDNNLSAEYEQWKESLNDRYGIKEYLFDGYTPSGNPRWLPNTVENASKLMNKQGLAGATGMASSFNRFVATLAPKKKSLSDIRSSKDLLVEDEKLVDDFRDKWSEVFFDLGIKCQPDAKGYEDYGLERLTEAAQKKNPGAYLKKEYGVELSQEDLQRLADMIKAIKTEFPTRYFETKFQRPVYLNEFAAAVIPTTTRADIKQAIAEAGLPIFEYDSSADGARREATLKATDIEGVRFSVFEPHNATMDEIDSLFHDYNGDKSLEPLYDKVSALAHTMGLQIRFDYPWSEAAGSTFGDKVKFNTEFFNSLAYRSQDKAHALLHEMIHATTNYAIAARNTGALTEGMKEAVSQLESIYGEIVNDRTFDGTYGAKSIYEMVAELSNPEFRSLLKEKNLFQRIVDAIKRLLGIEVGENALDNLSATLDYMLDNYDGRVFGAVVNQYQKHQEYTRFSVVNENQAIFVSNAARAVEAIKMEKATPAQWLAMIEKAGGLKAGEDKWMGLSDWLKESKAKTLTKKEVLDFINENKIVIEETHYAENAEDDAENTHAMIERILQEKFGNYIAEYYEQNNGEDDNLYGGDSYEYAMDKLREEMNDEFPYTIERSNSVVYLTFPYEETDDLQEWADKLGVKFAPQNPINNTRLNYTTNGLQNNHEIALVVPAIEPWNESDKVHFGDAGEGRAVAWIRFGETTDEFGRRVLVIDEIQSKRHQEGRDKGYSMSREEYKKRLDALETEGGERLRRRTELLRTLKEKYGEDFRSYLKLENTAYVPNESVMSPEEVQEWNATSQEEIDDAIDALKKQKRAGIPDAPFEKNWHELAMKRMLRYAAEEGYDVIAWTKGEQQAERYNLGKFYSGIERQDNPAMEGRRFVLYGGNMDSFMVNDEGVVIESTINEAINRPLSDIVGKELAVKMMQMDDNDMLDDADITIGGEGMKGFYDKMLPAFMNKYGKKWGVKVEDITLPNLEEAGQVMHSVPVTEEMKASVMEGQVMFSAVQIDPAVRQEMDTIKAKAMWDGTFMKAPNGADTKLTEDQWLMVRTNNFKNWFGDWINDPESASKVVDPETREPRVMYHGSAWHPLTEPKGNAVFRMRSGLLGRGAYFASSIEEATLYAEMATDIDVAIEGNYEILQDEYVTDYFLNIRNTDDIRDFGRGDIIAVAKSPSQIKSATDNTGEFSESEDIRFSAIKTYDDIPDDWTDSEIQGKEAKRMQMSEVTDEYFTNYIGSVIIPAPNKSLAEKIGSGNKEVLIKRGVFAKMAIGHGFTPSQSRDILSSSLYSPNLYGQSQKTTRPLNWVIIKTGVKNAATIIEVNETKDFLEVVSWYTLDERNLKRIERQAKREGGEILILDSEESLAASLSALPSDLSSDSKDSDNIENSNTEENISFDVNTNPTEAQKKAGNYKMGHLRLDGYNITIENPKGSVRRGTDSKGNEWENTLNNDYGYIRGTEGVDGDHIDVYLSDNPAEGNVFVIDQVNPETREFDEHKVMYGFNSMDEAREAYLANFSEGWNGLGTITEVTKDEFRKWIDSSHRKTKPFSEYKSVKAEGAQSEGYEEADTRYSVLSTPTDEIVAEGMKFSIQDFARLAGNIFQDMPESFRKEAIEETFKRGWDMQSAIFQIPARLAEKENWDESDKELAKVIRDKVQEAMDESGVVMSRPLTAKEALWMLYRSTEANGDSMLDAAKRAMVAYNLGFDKETLALEDEAKEAVRFSAMRDATVNVKASMYNRGAVNVMTRLKETFVDMNASVEELVSAIEERSGKKAKGFENIIMALNQQSSKGLAAMESYEMQFLNPMFDEIRKIMNETDFTYADIVRYVILKHGLERNEKLAQRDARSYYQEIYDDIIDKIRSMNAAQKRTYLTNAQLRDADAKAELARLQAIDTSAMSADEKREHNKAVKKAQTAANEAAEHLERAQKIASMSEKEAEDELQMHFDAIAAQTDNKYNELRKNDYSGITSMFYDQLGVNRSDYVTEEEYQSALMDAKRHKYDTLADVEAAADMEVKLFEEKVDTKGLWKRINAATKETLRQQYEANMISREQYDNLRGMFEYYVPLRGFKDNTAEDMYTYYRRPNSTGYTKPILAAEGRKTEAESPFGWIASMAGSAIASNVKNEAKLALYYFVSNRPENGIATVSKTWYVHTPGDVDERGKRIFRPAYPTFSEDLSTEEAKDRLEQWQEQMRELKKQGLAYESGQKLNLGNAVVNISEANKPEHIVNVKVAGKDYTIIINGNPRAAQAINGDLNIEATAQDYSAVFGPILRWMSSVNTSYNPEFWITNMMRDMAFTWMAVNTKESPEYRRKFGENYRKAFSVIRMVAKNEKGTLGDSYLEKMYKEFVEYGGVTGYTQIKDNETWEKEIEKYLSSNDPESIRSGKVMKGVKTVFHAFHRFGESLEQVSRFAAFLTSREMGKPMAEAVNDAKEITVNFNRKGSGKMISLEEAKHLTDRNGKPLSKFWQWVAVAASSISPLGRRFIMFFNAAIQGLNATYKLYKANPKRMIGWTLAYASLGMMNAVLHAFMDDDDDYLDIPQYERRNSLMIGGGGVYLKWALPQEARAFYALGDIAVESIMGRNPHQNVAGEIGKVFAELLPINPAEGWKAFLPSIAVPAFELLLNEDYKGDPIYNEMKWLTKEERKRTAKWSNAKKGTGKTWVLISQGLNNVTGGDMYDAGLINIQPEKMEHLVQSAFGGTIRTIDKFITTVIAMIDPEEEWTARQTPFLNRVLTINDERFRNVHVNDVFDFYRAEAEHAISLEKKYTKAKDSKALRELRSSDEYRWAKIYIRHRKALENINDKVREAQGTREKKELMKQQDELKKKMIKEFSSAR